MNEDLIVNDGDNTGITDGDNNDVVDGGSEGNRPNNGTGSAGPKRPGNGGGKGQYSLGDREEGDDDQTSPVEGEDGEGDSESDGE